MKLIRTTGRYCLLSCLLAAGILLQGLAVQGQIPFYSPCHVQDIRIVMPQPDWRYQLDSLMKAGNTDVRLVGEVYINGVHFPGCGVRFKGFSSWNQDTIKNPFNIRIDYQVRNRNYQGYTKIKLSNVLHDPSFLREVLSYHVAGQYMPAPGAGFANIYVNDTLIGLYSNAESIDQRFLEKHYGSTDRVLIKGSPEKLVFPFGQNSNLAFISSSDSLAYMPYYSLESDYGWQMLMEMINVLHHHPERIEEVLNVDRVLWMHAFNYALLNFDSYIAYAQNYYLASDQHGRLNPVIWDLNMSLGSFRHSDGSYLFQGMTIPQIINSDPLQHLTFSISPRPLMSVLFSDSTYRRMFMAHLRTIVSEQFESGALMDLAGLLHDIIDPFVQDDPNRFYSYSSFLSNLDTTVPGNTPGTAYVGLREMMAGRTAYLRSYPGFNAHPVIQSHQTIPEHPARDGMVQINAEVEGAGEVWLFYRFSSNSLFSRTRMYDDGLPGDSLPGDGIWGVQIPLEGDILHYYFYAQNDSAGIFLPARAQTCYFSLYPKIAPGRLVINEINRAPIMAHQGEIVTTTHWIELFNNSTDTLSLRNLRISNDSNGFLYWELPETLLPPHHFFMLFADGTGVWPDRCNFTLDQPDGWIGLGYQHDEMLDEVQYAHLNGNSTYGRYPNGTGGFTIMHASFAARNNPPAVSKNSVRIYPNPAANTLWVESVAEGACVFKIFSLDGRLHRKFNIEINGEGERPMAVRLDISDIAAGVYLIRFENNERLYVEKFIIHE